MNSTRSQNRTLAIIGIVAIILGLGVGLLWAGVGSSASTNPSPPTASNQTSAQSPSASATPGDDSVIPTVVTNNTGEAALSSNNSNVMQPTPGDSSTNANTDNSSASNNSTSDNTATGNANSNPASSSSTSGNANLPANSGSTGNTTGEATSGNAGATTNGTTSGATISTPTSGNAKPKHQKATASGTPTARKGKGNGKGKAAANPTAGKGNALGNQVPVAGVVESVDTANKLVVLDTNYGPVSATLATTATIQRQPIPGDSAAAGPIDLSNVQVGNYAIVLVNRSQLPTNNNALSKKQAVPSVTATPGASGTPSANNQKTTATQAKNTETLVKRKFGIRDGFSTTVSAMRVGPAPASIEANDSNPLLGLRAIPATFASLDSDGNIIATITKYGYIKVIAGPGTHFDRLGQPISATDLKPGDSIILYGEAAWVGVGNGSTIMDGTSGKGAKANPAGLPPSPGGKGTGNGPYANGLPIVERIAELHVVTINEHVLQGKVASVDTSANTFQITTATHETFTVTVAADTKYQSLTVGQSISSLSDLQTGSNVVAYTIGDSDIDPKIYNAKTVDLMPATK